MGEMLVGASIALVICGVCFMLGRCYQEWIDG